MFLHILSVKKLSITAVKKKTQKLIMFKKKELGMCDY